MKSRDVKGHLSSRPNPLLHRPSGEHAVRMLSSRNRIGDSVTFTSVVNSKRVRASSSYCLPQASALALTSGATPVHTSASKVWK
ncbi:Uncharacterised protein [Enterobacter cloacae]|nr:Uncharacterised protein [Enterobacter cloacae]